MSAWVIGIDGGGTRTRALLADSTGAVHASGEAGTSNPLVHGVAAAQRELSLAVSRAFAAANAPPARAAALCMGLGGAGRQREQRELVEWAGAHLAAQVRVVNDGEIVLAAGTPANWGVAVIAGTGSLAWGRNERGETARAGGWGYVMGDEGSGYDLARRALRAATQSADGRSEPTELLAAILAYWQLEHPTDLVGKVYRSGMTNAQLAELARVVIDTAARGDPAAKGLVRQAAGELARGVGTVCRTLGLEPNPIPLALAGGLLGGAVLLREELSVELKRADLACEPVTVVEQPVLGAVRLALELLDSPPKPHSNSRLVT